ncbi:MAG: hypothetical protein F4Y47_11765 [Acidobacteriia bacterium]|nr:hypothetical protein [Terriglobia bacterium]
MNKAAHQPDELLRRDVLKGALRPAWDYNPPNKPRLRTCVHASANWSFRFYPVEDGDDFLGIGIPGHLQRRLAEIGLYLRARPCVQ